MEDNGMKRRKVAINLVSANVFGLALMFVAVIVLMVPYFLIWGEEADMVLTDSVSDFMWFCIFFIVGIVVHELIHGATWALYAECGWKSISFGVIWKMLTPYCHCDVPLNKRAYMMGALMPLVVLGVIPGVVGVAINNLLVVVWGIVFISAAAGDIWMAWLMSKESSDSLFLDHPSEAGFYVIEK